MKRCFLVLPVFVLLICCSRQNAEFPKGEWIDLSHDFSSDTVYWVTAEPFTRTTVAEGKTDKGYFYSAYNFSAAEHGGTHIDAPVHFAEGGNRSISSTSASSSARRSRSIFPRRHLPTVITWFPLTT